MPANVQSMFYVGETPWHREGNKLKEPPKTSAEAIKLAGLDWNVYKDNLQSGGSSLLNHFAVKRSDTDEFLGLVGKNYEPLQNIDAFNFFNPLLENGYAAYETAGAIGNGEIIWVMAKIKESERFEVVKNDEVFKYVLLANGHDGKMAINIKFTPIRVVCQNTLNYALSDGTGTKIKHLPNMPFKMYDTAENMMASIDKTYKKIEETFREMAKIQMDQKKIVDYYKKVYSEPSEKLINSLLELIECGRGNDISKVRGSLWGVYNSITEYVDHPQNYRYDDNQLTKRIWFGEGEEIKNAALREAVNLLKAS